MPDRYGPVYLAPYQGFMEGALIPAYPELMSQGKISSQPDCRIVS
jgi:hypothetical protein